MVQTLALRYTSFVRFSEFSGVTASGLTRGIISAVEPKGLQMSNCRGQK